MVTDYEEKKKKLYNEYEKYRKNKEEAVSKRTQELEVNKLKGEVRKERNDYLKAKYDKPITAVKKVGSGVVKTAGFIHSGISTAVKEASRVGEGLARNYKEQESYNRQERKRSKKKNKQQNNKSRQRSRNRFEDLFHEEKKGRDNMRGIDDDMFGRRF